MVVQLQSTKLSIISKFYKYTTTKVKVQTIYLTLQDFTVHLVTPC